MSTAGAMRVALTRGDGIDALGWARRPVPEPGPGQLLLRMRAASLNYRDLLVIKGVGGWKPTQARVPLSDGVGEVVAAGAGAGRFRTGDRVLPVFLPRWHDGELTEATYAGALGGANADGVLAQYLALDADSVVAAPPHLSDEEAATLPVAALTAWHALRYRSQVRPGDSVLVQGSGGVSLFALLFARALGVHTIVLSGSDAKCRQLRELGADQTINYRQVPDWEREVVARTGGRGVDHVVEVVGGANLNRSLRAVRIGGTISFIGQMAGLTAPINTYEFVTRNVRLHGIETGSRAMFEDMNRFVGAHGLRPVLDRVFPDTDLRTALERLDSGAHFGKVVVRLPE